MKKLFIAASLLAVSFGSFAQDTKAPAESTGEGFVSKNGHQVLPEAGDFGVSFNAVPVLNYLGNSFNGTGGATGTVNSINSAFPSNGLAAPTINLKKFKDANTAIRAMFRLSLSNETQKNLVDNNTSTDPTSKVEDKKHLKETSVVLGLGLEKRKGKSRVQGFYGAMAFIQLTGTKNTFDYGNAYSATNTTPTTTTNFVSGANSGQGSRTLKQKTSAGFGLGVLGFVGAEYFIAPKLSLGAEFQWGPSLNFGSKLKTTTESLNLAGNGPQETETEEAGSSLIQISTDNVGGAINLNFYF